MNKGTPKVIVKRTFNITQKADERLEAILTLSPGHNKSSIVNKLILEGHINIAQENQKHLMHTEEYINQYNLSSLAIKRELQKISLATSRLNDDDTVKQELSRLIDNTSEYMQCARKGLDDLVHSKNRY